MLSSFLVIQDSEDEGSDNNDHYRENGMISSPPAALIESSSHLQSPSLSSGPRQISGEAREKAIKEAQSLLLAPLPDTPETPGVQPELVKFATAARSKTAHGRLEGSISKELDVYDFLVDDEDDGDFEPPGGKKRKRPAKKSRSVTGEGGELSCENQNGKPGKSREGSAMVGRLKSITDIPQDESSEDDWTPNSRIEKPAGKKSTRSNTNEKELAPLLPKPKRKPKDGAPASSNRFDSDLSLGIDITRVIGQSGEISTIQAGGNDAGFSSFMVDLTSEDLILATQRKAEYEALSLGLTGGSGATLLPVNFMGRESDAEDYPVLSTIPDPPSGGLGQSQPWGLEHNESLAVLPHQLPPQPPPQPPLLLEQQPIRMASSPLSSPPIEESGTGPPPSAAQIETSEAGRKSDTSNVARSNRAAKRSVTDGSIDTGGFGRVASEWRVAKGRSKTIHNVITLSDDEDHLVQAIPEKKKKAVRQRKSATIGEGAKRGAKGDAAATKKGKGKGKAVVNDSEDDGAFSDEAAAQRSIPSPSDAAADRIAAIHSELASGRRRPGDQVMIAVAIESPSKPAQKRKSTIRNAEEVTRPTDTLDPNPDLIYEKPQHDYESAPSSPKPVVPAKRATSGASAGRRKKKAKQELEDEEGNWDEEPKRTTKKAAVKSRNAKGLDAAVEATVVIEETTEIEAPSPKSAVKGRAAKTKVVRKLPVEEVAEQKLEEVEEAPAPLKIARKPKTTKAATVAGASNTEDNEGILDPTETAAGAKSPVAETETTPAPPERKSATPVSSLKKTPTTTPGRVPFRVGLSRKSKIPSLLRGFRK